MIFGVMYCDSVSLASAALSLVAIAVATVHAARCNQRRRKNVAKMTAVRAHRKPKSS